MLRKVEINCLSCDAVFSITHEMDEDFYFVSGCPFCLAELDECEEPITYKYDDDEESWVTI
jgi:hypothetical protein